LPEREDVQEEVRARSFWTGTLTFGLVSIPVALFPAQRSVRVSLRMLSEEGTPLRREYYDPETERHCRTTHRTRLQLRMVSTSSRS
jgi:DNA end-binding protein Ku